MGTMLTQPTPQELLVLDERLAEEGVAIQARPHSAATLWASQNGKGLQEAISQWRWFNQAYAALHPSVSFGDNEQALCVTARGVAYRFSIPFIFGHYPLDPLEFVIIGSFELDRIKKDHPESYFSLIYQSADIFDLFTMDRVRIDGNQNSSEMMAVGTSLLRDTARALVAGATGAHAGLAHTMCVAVETITKSALIALGVETTSSVSKYGHSFQRMCKALQESCPAVNDEEYLLASGGMPNLVQTRYGGGRRTTADEHKLFRRALFLSAEAMRRTSVNLNNLFYRDLREMPAYPPRRWDAGSSA